MYLVICTIYLSTRRFRDSSLLKKSRVERSQLFKGFQFSSLPYDFLIRVLISFITRKSGSTSIELPDFVLIIVLTLFTVEANI